MIARALFILALAAAPLPTATPLQAAAPTPRQPTRPWVLDFGESQCVAYREYSTPADRMTLALKPSPVGGIVELLVLRTASGTRYAREVPATIRVGDRAPIAAKLLVYKPGKDSPRFARTPLAAAAADLRGARTLTITAEGELDAHLALGGTANLATEMARCLSGLQDHWNISPARSAALRTPVQGTLRGVLRAEDYPAAAIDRNAEGTVGAALLIDEAGRVADCTLTSTSGYALLDAISCIRIRENAKYTPAVGADGKPAKSATQGRITFRIDNDPSRATRSRIRD